MQIDCVEIRRCWWESCRHRQLQDLRQARDDCTRRITGGSIEASSSGARVAIEWGKEREDISLRKLSEAMDINLQHPNGERKKEGELVEALVAALLSEVPVLGNFHASFVDTCLKDLRQVRDGLSGLAERRGELHKHLRKLKIKDPLDHVVTLRDLSLSLELPVGSKLSKEDYVQQIITALLAEAPAAASVDDAKTALVDSSLRELLVLRDGLAGQASQRQELESRLDQFNVRTRRSDVVTLRDLCKSLGTATGYAGSLLSWIRFIV